MHTNRWLVALAACAIAGAAGAQSAKRPDPAHPQAAAPPLRYESAFAGYRPLREEGVGKWREVNDRVRDAAAERAAALQAGAPPGVPPPGPAVPAPVGTKP